MSLAVAMDVMNVIITMGCAVYLSRSYANGDRPYGQWSLAAVLVVGALPVINLAILARHLSEG